MSTFDMSIFDIELEDGAMSYKVGAKDVELITGRPCFKCGGTGKYTKRLACFRCNGTGKLQAARLNSEDFAEKHPAVAAWIAANPENNFAKSLGEAVAKYGSLTPNQLAAAERAATAPAQASDAISVEKIETAFAAARGNGIKSPKLRLGEFMFSRAPDHGRNAGSIYVKRGEQYLGKVTAGQFYACRDCDDDTRKQVVDVAASPADAAKAYGLRTGSCSCCGRTLTNGASIDLGIGPICAEKFGW